MDCVNFSGDREKSDKDQYDKNGVLDRFTMVIFF
jgi:hypothetical protein